MVTNLTPGFLEEELEESNGKAIYCKFVLIIIGEDPNFVLGPIDKYAYHANLVNAFCEDRDIAASWTHKPDMVEIYDKNVRMAGGGWIKYYPDGMKIELVGQSTAYGPFNRETLQTITKRDEFFTTREVLVRN